MINHFKFGRGYLDGLKYRITEPHGESYIVNFDYKDLSECLERNGVKSIDSLMSYWNSLGENKYEIIDYSRPTEQIRVGVVTMNRHLFRRWFEDNQMASITRTVRQSGKNIRVGNTLYRNITHHDDMRGCRFDYFIDTSSADLNSEIDIINEYKRYCMTV